MKIKQPSRYVDDKRKQAILEKLRKNSRITYLYTLIAFKTGLRLGEIAQYIDKSVSGDINVYINPLKTNKNTRRYIPVIPEAIEARELAVPKSDSIRKTISRLFDDFSIHDCRKTFATNMANIIKDPYQLCAIMGWSEIKTADKYVRLNPEKFASYYKFGWSEETFDSNLDYHQDNIRLKKENEELKEKLRKLSNK